MGSGERPTIEVSAVVIRDGSGLVLTVRKRGTDAFMLPGGKPEPGESPVQAAVRELAEELDLEVCADDLRPLGRFVAAAANEADTLVQADVFEAPQLDVRGPAAEIDELRWLAVEQHRPSAVPVLLDLVLPLLGRTRGDAPRA